MARVGVVEVMAQVMAAMGVVPGTEASKSACALLKMVDKDGSGQLDEEEFKVWYVVGERLVGGLW